MLEAPLPMQRLMFDTKVVVDVFEQRPAFFAASSAAFHRVEGGQVTGILCATTLTTMHYLLRKTLDKARVARLLRDLAEQFEIAPVTRAVLQAAFDSTQPDFEDAVLAEAAKAWGATTIITRNTKDFVGCGLPVFTPLEWLESDVH